MGPGASWLSLVVQYLVLGDHRSWTVAWSILHRGSGWGVDSGLVGLYRKGMLEGEFFTISRNWLTLGRTVLNFRVLKAPRYQSIKYRRLKTQLRHKYNPWSVPAHFGVGGRKCRANQACDLLLAMTLLPNSRWICRDAKPEGHLCLAHHTLPN